MGIPRDKVVVAMSGGVDSSVAAHLLKEQGYDVMGLFMRVGADQAAPGPTDVAKASGRSKQGCCSAADAADARFVAGMLDIPFYALNFQKEFGRIIDYFAAEYAQGRTPNPCVVCNDQLKFGKILDYADAVGARYIATGHYARLGTRNGRRVLMRARDEHKDQTYVLFGLDRNVLDRVLFPLGELEKREVREMAARHGLPNHDKPDSVEICFVPSGDYAEIVRRRHPAALTPGDVLDPAGNIVGKHRGIARYTVGQRRGLGIAAGQPIYVSQLNVAENTVTVDEPEALLANTLTASRANFLVDPPEGAFRAQVKIRYLHRPAAATVHPLGGYKVRVEFDEPQRAITPGQATVFYDGEVTLGGAWIDRAKRRAPSVENTTAANSPVG